MLPKYLHLANFHLVLLTTFVSVLATVSVLSSFSVYTNFYFVYTSPGPQTPIMQRATGINNTIGSSMMSVPSPSLIRLTPHDKKKSRTQPAIHMNQGSDFFSVLVFFCFRKVFMYTRCISKSLFFLKEVVQHLL